MITITRTLKEEDPEGNALERTYVVTFEHVDGYPRADEYAYSAEGDEIEITAAERDRVERAEFERVTGRWSARERRAFERRQSVGVWPGGGGL